MGKLGFKGHLAPFVNSVVIEAMLGSYFCCLTLEEVRVEGFRIRVGELEVKAEDDWYQICRNEASIVAGRLSVQLQPPATSLPVHELNPLGCCAKDNPCWGGGLPLSQPLLSSGSAALSHSCWGHYCPLASVLGQCTTQSDL